MGVAWGLGRDNEGRGPEPTGSVVTGGWHDGVGGGLPTGGHGPVGIGPALGHRGRAVGAGPPFLFSRVDGLSTPGGAGSIQPSRAPLKSYQD